MPNGLDPGPDSTDVTPTCDAAEQVPAAACASGQSGTDPTLANRPGGSETFREPRSCWPSGRPKLSTKDDDVPAVGFDRPASSVGSNFDALSQPLLMVNVLSLDTTAGDAQEVNSACVVYVPQTSG